MKPNFVFTLIIALLLSACEKLTDSIVAAANTSPKILQQKAESSGLPIDEYVYSIVLRYGLNGVPANTDEADRLEASATGDGQVIATSGGATINYGNKIAPMTIGVVRSCIAALEASNREYSTRACGSRQDFILIDTAWRKAKGN